MDPVVVGARVPGRQRQRARQLRADLRGPRARPAVAVPPVVRVQVHHGFGGEHRDVRIARISARELAHPLGVGLFVDREGSPAGGCRADSASTSARSRRAACGASASRARQRIAHARRRGGIHVGVDGGAERPGEPPPAQDATRVDLGRRRERARRFGRVEAPCERHALREVALRRRPVARLRHRRRGQAREQRRRRRGGRCRRAREHEREQQRAGRQRDGDATGGPRAPKPAESECLRWIMKALNSRAAGSCVTQVTVICGGCSNVGACGVPVGGADGSGSKRGGRIAKG